MLAVSRQTKTRRQTATRFRGITGSGWKIRTDHRSNNGRLLQAAQQTGDLKAHPAIRLNEVETAALARWLESGGRWPPLDTTSTTTPHSDDPLFSVAEKSFWAFQPIQDPSPPVVKGYGSSLLALDRFILPNYKPKVYNRPQRPTRNP